MQIRRIPAALALAGALTTTLAFVGALSSAPALAAPDTLTVVEAERAFARDAAAHGVRDAFLAWLAPTAVGFREGPLQLRKAYAARPQTPARLAWEPAFAATSAAGDLAWTTGPWTWRADSTRDSTQAWGEYATMWRRQSDGTWKATLDMGISHDAPSAPGAALEERTLPGPGTSSVSALSSRHAMWKADADYDVLAAKSGVGAAIDRYAAPELIVLREGRQRIRGADAARATLTAIEKGVKLMSLAQFTGNGGDLGYAYGSHVLPGTAGPDTSYYLHIWHRDGRVWKLVLDAAQPATKRKG